MSRATADRALDVVRAGGATIQDAGRPGLLHLGIPPSGAADRRAHDLANRLVGNEPSAAGLELTLGGLVVRFWDHGYVALTGAPAPVALGGRAAAFNTPTAVRPGDLLEVGSPHRGVRSYLAVRGGIDVPAALGSRATDTFTGLGPPPVRDGDRLGLGEPTLPMPGVEVAPVPEPEEAPTVRVVLGPRADWLDDDSRAALTSTSFSVTPDCSRVGVRLRGDRPLRRTRQTELQSEPMLGGALQLPPSGGLILLLADHPTVGGYPVVAVLADDELSRAAQWRPGQRVRFAATEPSWSHL